jgi:pimeloyl-ACP methyl ester carboxylesterase
MRLVAVALALVLASPSNPIAAAEPAWADASPHRQGFVESGGIRLEYLDWGGNGPALILIHGAGDNPHVFDDLAPAFTDRFHVIAYARRGSGRSEAKGPYDTVTLTEDLRGFMDALRIENSNLVGWSQGGNEITAMAATHPERVRRLVYLDAAYDWGDRAFVRAFKALPPGIRTPPASAMVSLNAYRSYEKATDYTGLNDMNRVEAYLRASVVVESDGHLRPQNPPGAAEANIQALLKDRRDYLDVRAPALAIYAESFLDVHGADPQERRGALEWEHTYMMPFRRDSETRVRRELRHVEIINVKGAHDSFFLTSREQVVVAMRRFLKADDDSR